MIPHFRYVLPTALILGTTVGCHTFIHQYPDIESHPPDHDKHALVVVEVNVDRLPPKYYKSVVYDGSWTYLEHWLDPIRADAHHIHDTLSLRVQLEIYDHDDEGEPIAYRVYNIEGHDTNPTDTLHFDLYEKNHVALAWADYVDVSNPEKDRFFLTNRLTNVETIVEAYPANTYARSCMAGQQDFDVKFDSSLDDSDLLTYTVSVSLERPVGCYSFLFTDDDEFIAQGGKPEEVSVLIVYKQYIATGYNVLSSNKNLFVSSYEVFIPSILDADTPDDEQPLFGDYLFCDPDDETIVIADFYLYDGQGRLFNRCQNIRIPLMQNRRTLIYGPCLTKSSVSSGGVALDENFEGETVIRFN